jgi:hypothetical protein
VPDEATSHHDLAHGGRSRICAQAIALLHEKLSEAEPNEQIITVPKKRPERTTTSDHAEAETGRCPVRASGAR